MLDCSSDNTNNESLKLTVDYAVNISLEAEMWTRLIVMHNNQLLGKSGYWKIISGGCKRIAAFACSLHGRRRPFCKHSPNTSQTEHVQL